MLQESMRKKRAGESGFTLIELLIVIVILGILAAIVVFAVGGITDKGEKASCKSEYKTVEVALEAYYAKVGSYPASMAGLTTGANKFLRDTPSHYDIDAAGGIVLGATPGTCTNPPT